ncbi:MAG: BrnT family toxin [Candidatus Eisenbacteria bacterium]|uniref:BrnT family toxin n=1 Tax=Eiseniibacteriota bacterium TaxID=2212470 RepID=A0A937X931_UNCEI|nr:BrnT family toxin [Candidatus Eisenbacteria bacterium]
MRVTWDPAKARVNLRKHGIRSSDAEGVLFDPLGVTIEDPMAMGEQRFVSLGRDSLRRTLVVVHAHRGGGIRLISARLATRGERRRHEEGV